MYALLKISSSFRIFFLIFLLPNFVYIVKRENRHIHYDTHTHSLTDRIYIYTHVCACREIIRERQTKIILNGKWS